MAAQGIDLDVELREVHLIQCLAHSGITLTQEHVPETRLHVLRDIRRNCSLAAKETAEHSALKILRQVNELRPDLPVVVRTTDDTHIEALKQAGAAEVVAEVLEGSVMLASQALLMSGVPLNRVIRRIQENRARRYSMFSSFFRSQAAVAPDVTENMQPRFRNVFLGERDAAVGKTLDEMNLTQFQIEVNALRRHNVRGSQPAGDMVLQAGDVLVLLGQPAGLTAAEQHLHEG